MSQLGPLGSQNGALARWLLGAVAAAFLLSIGVSTAVTVFVSSTTPHPVTKEEHNSMQDDIREIREDVKTLLRRD